MVDQGRVWPGEQTMAPDEQVLESLEKLADILACIFIESQEIGTMDAPDASGRQRLQQSTRGDA
jgi:hypothetical protein